MDLLRFLTAGNVDDGKSTLIGRLLYDSGSVSTDILQAAEKASKGKNNPANGGTGSAEIDLSLLTDGLRAEREQGITIDVAYKYFTTAKRKFIIADTPGHVQYTRNMVTGASNSNLAIILIDARNGITEQTCRHSIISSMFGIQHLAVCVNKIDLMNYSEKVFNEIVFAYNEFGKKLFVKDITYIPVSAKFGDNVVEKSSKMPWYKGKMLLAHLETVEVDSDINFSSSRFPVQYVIRPQKDELHDYRGYAGKIVSGVFRKGDEVKILPAGISSRIKEIEMAEKKPDEAFAPQPVVIHLEDDIDISRGDLIVKKDNSISTTQDIEATVCWMSELPMNVGAKFLIRHHGKTVKASVRDVLYKINVTSLEKIEGEKSVSLNEIARIQLRAASPLALDEFKINRANGSFLLIDENTNDTVGGCVV
ncbi:MAG: sulfate adenylyltransferase [Bacteroidetes bacterium]|nr:sulfate adenylyltransferase [Bacteroidota bacterium]